MNNESAQERLLEAARYFLLTTPEQESRETHKQALEGAFIEHLSRLIERLDTGQFQSGDCQGFADDTDRLLVMTVELIHRGVSSEALEELKEKLWMLLEHFEDYCQQQFRISIW